MCFAPYAQNHWFVPFVNNFIQYPSIDPWTSYLPINVLGFPYGLIMFCGVLPFIPIGILTENLLQISAAVVSIKLSIFASDLLFFYILLKELSERHALIWYWLSPIVLGAGYWAGQLDILPTLLLTWSLFMLRRNNFSASAFLLACAISAKLSSAIVLPFFCIYMIKNTRLSMYRRKFFLTFSFSLLIFCAILLFSHGYNKMALESRELARFFELRVSLGQTPIYITPILYGAFLFSVWHLRRISFSLLFTLCGCSLFLIILTTVTPPGWFLWIVPFVAKYASSASKLQTIPSMCFYFAAFGCQLFFSEAPIPIDTFFDALQLHPMFIVLKSCWQSGVVFFGIMLMWSMLRVCVFGNDLFKISIRPVSIGIAGDSGSGKDTCARSIVNLLGKNSVVQINGDDYHLWERNGQMWQSVTHLAPLANSLNLFHADVHAAIDRKSTYYRIYDHNSGRFSVPKHRESSDFVLAVGLHALHQESINNLYDVTVFLDMEESLRTYFKCHRDVFERKYSLETVLSSIERRKKDALLFITPQRDKAEIIFRLEAEDNLSLDDLSFKPRLRLRATLRNSMYHQILARNLILTSSLNVEMFSDGQDHILIVRGTCSANVLAYIARTMLKDLDEYISPEPKFENNMTGIMQLIILNHLVQNCKARRSC
jgi:uridine kinase